MTAVLTGTTVVGGLGLGGVVANMDLDIGMRTS
jgi:hypothetical protein